MIQSTTQRVSAVWRCADHPYLNCERQDLETYYSPLDVKPAYNSYVFAFVDKADNTYCCPYANRLKQKTDGYTRKNYYKNAGQSAPMMLTIMKCATLLVPLTTKVKEFKAQAMN